MIINCFQKKKKKRKLAQDSDFLNKKFIIIEKK